MFGLFLLRPINASVTERGIVGMLEKQQQKRNCTEVLFFITKDIKLGYLSAQGRALIYFYLMTLIIVSRLSYFLLFY